MTGDNGGKPPPDEGKEDDCPRYTPRMSIYDFMKSRMDDVIYVRPIQDENGSTYAAYAADGTFLDMFDSLGEVISASRDQNRIVATVH